jgi:signal transduction histidine kinase
MLPNGFLARVSQGGEHIYMPETQLRTSKGETFWARLIGNRLEDIEQTIGMAFSVQDISQVKKLEEEKIEAERMAIVGETVAGLSHGIKNLVNALDGGMYYLKSGIGKGDVHRVQKGIETLTRNIERIRVFSKSFLNFSSLKKLEPTLCDPVSIAKEVLESHLVKARNNDIELKLDAQNKIEPVSLDYEKIHECLTNLVGNAIDACIEMEEKKNKLITIRVYEEERTVFYEIIDTGTGIDKEIQSKIFNKFFTTKGLEGTGLGLLMVKKIIQEHGGQIDLFSRMGEGSIFRIRLIRRLLPKISNVT